MDKSQYIRPREYELMVILLPDQPEADTQAAIDSIVGYITDQQGEITSLSADSPWGRRRLAYTIRHDGVDYRDGFYILSYFSALPAAITDIERELKLDTRVIRYLLLTNDPTRGEKSVPGEDVEESDAEAEDAPVEEAAAGEAVEETADEAEAVTEAVAEEAASEVVAEAVAEAVAEEAAVEDEDAE